MRIIPREVSRRGSVKVCHVTSASGVVTSSCRVQWRYKSRSGQARTPTRRTLKLVIIYYTITILFQVGEYSMRNSNYYTNYDECQEGISVYIL